MVSTHPDLERLARTVREHPGLRGKRDLAAVASILGGDGDDAAVLPDGDGHLVLAAEAIWPPLVAGQPRAAGVAGVVTVLNDRPPAGPGPSPCSTASWPDRDAWPRTCSGGLRIGADLYEVPVVGGPRDGGGTGAMPSLSTFAAGRARSPLSARNARAGGGCRDPGGLPRGRDHGGGPGGTFFSHLRGGRRERAATDLALLADAAEAGEAWAARDVSMPGVAGSLLSALRERGRPGLRPGRRRAAHPTGHAARPAGS